MPSPVELALFVEVVDVDEDVGVTIPPSESDIDGESGADGVGCEVGGVIDEPPDESLGKPAVGSDDDDGMEELLPPRGGIYSGFSQYEKEPEPPQNSVPNPGQGMLQLAASCVGFVFVQKHCLPWMYR